ncbi:MAG: nuclear transport factor 2 family protein [Verrucomicrobia bacterium]|nr:nuclear transport factor 2 family protein [Verrucomicrobiota bacterium]MCG2678955.1 nuclear transport factor 2 family protein [Kiritimatiellia bacterium]MBU4248292.1 nuclear transport factor 2 family protein [Verrucomicrobiota bacterium]MBU4291781.1 nuclear transport factor 2 family protein [Verrucomicrobiota bacterium]MBU4429159.1 nuclear transport factor 2 family protein [Verrucomicrobiota bacterium]
MNQELSTVFWSTPTHKSGTLFLPWENLVSVAGSAPAPSQFLGWPGAVPHPIDREESARFMKQLVPKHNSCTFKIERAGIRLLGEVALTQYIIHVNFSETAGVKKTQSSRITHTWVKDGACWKLLGGMSYDK